MLGLTGGELGLVAFLTLSLVTARWWPRFGAALAARRFGPEDGAAVESRPEPKDAVD